MLKVMLCGAEDTNSVSVGFTEVVRNLGGDPWHFVSGRIHYINSGDSDWSRNSRNSVKNSDLCIFVIVRQIGEITWSQELTEALNSGKPFIVLCLENTYHRYRTLSSLPRESFSGLPAEDRGLVQTVHELEMKRNLTVVQYNSGNFQSTLLREISNIFQIALREIEKRNLRATTSKILSGNSRLTNRELVVARDIALDELEDKKIRKEAIKALAAHRFADEEAVIQLLSSSEQGVQRITLLCLEDLYTIRPAEEEFFESCVEIANDSDDVGVTRRLISALMKVDFSMAIAVFSSLKLKEVGSRRRLAMALEEYEENIVEKGLGSTAVDLLNRCLNEDRESDWTVVCRNLRDRLIDS